MLESLFKNAPELNRLTGDKKRQVMSRIENAACGQRAIHMAYHFNFNQHTTPFSMDDILHFAMDVARDVPLDVDGTRIVFFSGSSMAKAEDFINEKPEYDTANTILPGALMGLFALFKDNGLFNEQQRYAPWKLMSPRLAHLVKGNVTAILDDVRPSATFLNDEMPVFLKNDAVETINEIDKWAFWKDLPLQNMDKTGADRHKRQILNKYGLVL